MKPAKVAGKQKQPAHARTDMPDSAPPGQSTFEDALRSLQEELAIELEKDVWGCEQSTKTAVDAAQPAERLPAFYSGFNEWGDKLCASGTRYYNKCFGIALTNRLPHDYLLSLAKISNADKLRSPAGFAKGLTEADISAFLKVTAFDQKEPAREIGSHGRVRWFVRYVCGDLSGRYPTAYAEQEAPFLLPLWFQHEWNIKASMAKLAWRPPGSAPFTPPIDESSFLSAEETEKFIFGMEESLIGKLREGDIAAAHRKALISLGEIGTATDVPSKADPVAAERVKMPNYTSDIKNAVFCRLAQAYEATDRQLCDWLDLKGTVDLPPSWATHGNDRSFVDAYADRKVRPKMESRFSEVRRDMRRAGYPIP
jgi:hypothetical protein